MIARTDLVPSYLVVQIVVTGIVVTTKVVWSHPGRIDGHYLPPSKSLRTFSSASRYRCQTIVRSFGSYVTCSGSQGESQPIRAAWSDRESQGPHLVRFASHRFR